MNIIYNITSKWLYLTLKDWYVFNIRWVVLYAWWKRGKTLDRDIMDGRLYCHIWKGKRCSGSQNLVLQVDGPLTSSHNLELYTYYFYSSWHRSCIILVIWTLIEIWKSHVFKWNQKTGINSLRAKHWISDQNNNKI